MRTPQEIITEFKAVLYWSQPNVKHDEMLALINELEASLNPIEEPIVEAEQVVLMKNEEGIFEEFTVNEEPVVKEPTVEVVAPKKTTTRKK
jgi:hypothetical protein